MGCGIRSRSNAPRVRYGTDTIFSVVLYRHDGEIGTSLDPNVADVIEPSSLASITAEVRTEFGGVEDVPITIHGKMLKVEVTREMTERLSLGVYLLRLKVRAEDIRFADGYRDMVLVTELCQVVSEGADAGCPQGNIAVAISKLAEGKSAYQAYLDTTNDSPKMTEAEWATGGWLVVFELIKNVRGTR